MTVYTVTAPNGLEYDIEGEGTEEEALAEFQRQWDANGGNMPDEYVSVPENEPQQPGLLQRAMNYMEESGKNTREAVMNPSQSIPDVLRSTGDFVSMGLTDRLRSAIYGTSHEQENAETEAAGERVGSLDDALNFGSALVQPSAAAKYAKTKAADAVTRLATYGTENAGLSGAQAVIEGEDPLDAMGKGFVFGAGGSAAGDLLGNFGRGKPKYKPGQEDAFHAAADKAPQNRRAGIDIRGGSERLEKIQRAEKQGQAGFKDLDRSLQQPGVKDAEGWGRKQADLIGDLAFQKRPGLGGFVKRSSQRAGEAMTENFPLNVWTLGAPKLLGQIPKGIGEYMSDVKPKTVKTLKANELATGGVGKGLLSPERTEELREILARAAMFKTRNQ